MTHPRISVISMLLSTLLTIAAFGQSVEKEMSALAQKLAEKLVLAKHARVTVLDFTDNKRKQNELGTYLADQLSIELVNIEKLVVLDRRNMARILEEHQLTAEGLIDPENAKKIGQFAGVEATIIGSIVLLDDGIELSAQAISTQTAQIVAAGRMKIASTPTFQKMLGQAMSASGGKSAVTPSFMSPDKPQGATVAEERDAIITKKLGPATIALKAISKLITPTDQGSVPAIRLVFLMTNNNLDRSVAVAVNQVVRETEQNMPGLDRYRGGLADNEGNSWTLHVVKGVPGVMCFEAKAHSFQIDEFDTVTQANPGGIADYIKTATKYEGGMPLDEGQSARFWSGSVGTIPPGESTTITLDCYRIDVGNGGSDQERFWTIENHNSGKKQISPWPRTVDFDTELVVGTYEEGEEAIKSKNLSLQTLAVGDISLPLDVAPSR